MRNQKTKLVVGGGALYIDPFDLGTYDRRGEIYFGNVPDLTITIEQSVQDRVDSVNGVLVLRDSAVIRESASAEATTDNISLVNMALWLGASIDTTYTNEPAIVQTTQPVYRGRSYQVGASDDDPMGRRNLGSISVVVGGTPVLPEGNWSFDLAAGRVYILPGSTIADGTVATIVGAALKSEDTLLVPDGKLTTGALRFVSASRHGGNTDYLFPDVDIVASGNQSLKAKGWRELSFRIRARRRPGYRLYYAVH